MNKSNISTVQSQTSLNKSLINFLLTQLNDTEIKEPLFAFQAPTRSSDNTDTLKMAWIKKK